MSGRWRRATPADLEENQHSRYGASVADEIRASEELEDVVRLGLRCLDRLVFSVAKHTAAREPPRC
jgi:hypothetical protein